MDPLPDVETEPPRAAKSLPDIIEASEATRPTKRLFWKRGLRRDDSQTADIWRLISVLLGVTGMATVAGALLWVVL